MLQTIDNVLRAANKKLAIYIEDLDRNWQGEKVWNEVLSLLDRLKEFENVSFVLCISDAVGMGSALNRIATHIEVVPHMLVADVAIIYKNVRTVCFRRFQDFRPCSDDDRDLSMGTMGLRKDENDFSYYVRRDLYEPINAVTELIGSPRNLKAALRRTYRAWSTLHGEIDFDNLFVANVLRVAASEVFVFIHENLSVIRRLGESREVEKIRTPLHNKFASLADQGKATQKLLEFMFPFWRTEVGRSSKEAVQGVSDSEPTDYWNRLVSEVVTDSMRDQQVLRAISAWKADNTSQTYDGMTLAQAITSVPGFAKKVEQFETLLDGKEARILAKQCFSLVIDKPEVRSTWEFQGYDELRNIVTNKFDESGHSAWITETISFLLCESLLAAIDILGKWSDPFAALLTSRDLLEVGDSVVNEARQVYRDIHMFIRAISDQPRDTVFRFVTILQSEPFKERNTGFRYEKWKWLSDLLLLAAEKNKAVVMPQIASFAVFREHFPAGPLSWVQERIAVFFRDRETEVMALLAAEIDTSDITKENKEVLVFAQGPAKDWPLKHQRQVFLALLNEIHRARSISI
jgi:hypothetical protein